MARFADIEAGYVYVTLDDVEYRVYVEQAGSGIPLLCQHTAGSDSRQWRHIIEDPEITKEFRVVAYDLPYHGKSLPPATARYWESEYKLYQDWFMRFIVRMAHELELERPIYMGCSMGGHMAGDLALHYPDEFRAAIGLEAAMHSHGTDTLLPWYWHPRLSNDSKPAFMHTLCSPLAPEQSVRETIWCYSQGAPPVFKGDLNYYSKEHDLTETAKDIDTGKIDFYVLNGDYDWSAYPEAGKELADAAGGKFQVMEGMGHFPMSEDPERFKRYLMPILNEIKSKSPAQRSVAS